MHNPYKFDWSIILWIFAITLLSFSATIGFNIIGWVFKTYGG